MRPLIFFMGLLFLSHVELAAKLVWEEQELTFEAKLGQVEIPILFNCKNMGDRSIRFTSLSSPCQCLEIQLDTKDVAPGESRVIPVVFHSGHRQGEQRFTFKVYSDDGVNQEAHALTVSGAIPEMLTIDPPVLVWNAREGIEPREFTVKLAEGLPFEVKEIYSMDENFLTSSVHEDQMTTVSVHPQKGSVRRLARAAIVVETAEKKRKTFYVLMRIADRDPNIALSPKLKNALYWPEEINPGSTVASGVKNKRLFTSEFAKNFKGSLSELPSLESKSSNSSK